MRRVVVTGLGTINPLGNNVDSSWSSLVNSESGISKISRFDVDNLTMQRFKIYLFQDEVNLKRKIRLEQVTD